MTTKRTIKQNRQLKKILKEIDRLIGEQNAGLIIYVLYESLRTLTISEIRSIEIKYNNFFSTAYDFIKNEFNNNN